MLLTEYNETETMELFKEEGREEERKVSEERDRRRVWKMHERGKSISEIADDMEIGVDTVQKWINGPIPAQV